MTEYKRDDSAQQTTDTASVFRSINLMSVGVAALLSTGMIVDKHSVTVSVLSGVGFYGAIAGLLILWQPGALPSVIINRQNQITIRRRDELPYRAQWLAHSQGQRVSLVDPLQIGREESAQPVQLPNFVSPIAEPDDSAKREAGAWILQLYGKDGNPDPNKVLMETERERPGRVRIAAPSRPAKQWLLDKHIIHDLGNGYRLNLVRYPTIEAVRVQLSQPTPSPLGHLPTTPYAESGGV